jgi:hypothetical protein
MITTMFVIYFITNTAFWGFLAWDAWGRKVQKSPAKFSTKKGGEL